MPIGKKIEVLTQEAFRRLHNTNEDVEDEVKNEIMNKFMEKLKRSGYDEKDRLEILKGGINTFKRLKAKEEKGERPFFRPSRFKKKERLKKKSEKKNSWFKHKNDVVKSVMFVDPSPKSELMKLLKETEDKHKISDEERIKFVEKAGMKAVDVMKVNDPFRKNCPPEKHCLPCKNGKRYSFCI